MVNDGLQSIMPVLEWRMGCSKLNTDLCFKMHVIGNPTCSCGNQAEDSYHYFFECDNFLVQRQELFDMLTDFEPITVDLFLHGNSDLSPNENTLIFSSVQQYVLDTNRF